MKLIFLVAMLMAQTGTRVSSRDVLQLTSKRAAIEKATTPSDRSKAQIEADAFLQQLREKYKQAANCTIPPHSGAWVCE